MVSGLIFLPKKLILWQGEYETRNDENDSNNNDGKDDENKEKPFQFLPGMVVEEIRNVSLFEKKCLFLF